MGSSAAKVGLFVVLALVLIGGAYVWLQGAFLGEPTTPYSVEFENAQGITEGTVVRMAGVKIGEVDDVTLDPETRRALVVMKIQQRYTISTDDRITIATGGLLPAPYIEIIPARRSAGRVPGAYTGVEATTLDQLFPKAESLLTEMTNVTRSLQSVVGDPRFREDLKSAAASIAATSERGQRIAANLEALTARGHGIVASLERAGRSAEVTMAQARLTVTENRGRLAELTRAATRSLEEIEKTLVEARALIADEQTREDLRGTLANVRAASAAMRAASESLAQTAADVQGLTGDPKLQEDLRETVAGARTTVEAAAQLLQRINQIVGGGRGGAAGTRQRLRDVELRVDVQQTTDPGQPRVDVQASVLGGAGRFTRFGLYDLGENTRLNLELGRPLQPDLSLRYGLHASRLGVGLDWGGRVLRPRLSADLYGLDDPVLDLRAATRLRPNLDLTVGMDRIFRDNAPSVGLRWHK